MNWYIYTSEMLSSSAAVARFCKIKWLITALAICVASLFTIVVTFYGAFHRNGSTTSYLSPFFAASYYVENMNPLNCESLSDRTITWDSTMSSNTTLNTSRTRPHPNIVYMLADDLGYGDVGYNGGAAYTPNINNMAIGPNSIRFDRFYSGGPTCSPTRGTLLTGRNHNRYCIWHADLGNPKDDLTCPSLMPLPDSEITIAEILRDMGYKTVVYGKWHVGDLKPVPGGNKKWRVANPTIHGFTDWLVTERHTSNLLSNCQCSKSFSCSIQGYNYYIVFCRNYWYENPLTKRLEKSKKQIFEDSHFIVDRFEEFLSKRNRSKPFYAQLSFHNVHSQYLATPYWKRKYKAKGYGDDHSNFLGAISSLDESVGRVRKLLRDHGLANDTIVWFSSDNGPQLHEPGTTGGLRGRKGTVYEGGIRVPGIIEWPGVIKHNQRSSVPVTTTDFLPTISEIVGAKIPQDRIIDGLSILPLLKNTSQRCQIRGSNMKFAFHIRKGDLDSEFSGAVVGDRYKFFADFSGGKIQNDYLFDLNKDSAESEDVSKFKVALTRSMRSELWNFLHSVTKDANDIGCLPVHDRRDVLC